jgi:hypothetical protein
MGGVRAKPFSKARAGTKAKTRNAMSERMVLFITYPPKIGQQCDPLPSIEIHSGIHFGIQSYSSIHAAGSRATHNFALRFCFPHASVPSGITAEVATSPGVANQLCASQRNAG